MILFIYEKFNCSDSVGSTSSTNQWSCSLCPASNADYSRIQTMKVLEIWEKHVTAEVLLKREERTIGKLVWSSEKSCKETPQFCRSPYFFPLTAENPRKSRSLRATGKSSCELRWSIGKGRFELGRLPRTAWNPFGNWRLLDWNSADVSVRQQKTLILICQKTLWSADLSDIHMHLLEAMSSHVPPRYFVAFNSVHEAPETHRRHPPWRLWLSTWKSWKGSVSVQLIFNAFWQKHNRNRLKIFQVIF